MKLFESAYAYEMLGVEQFIADGKITLFCITTLPHPGASLRWRLRLVWHWLVHRELVDEIGFLFYTDQVPPLVDHLRSLAGSATPDPHPAITVLHPYPDDENEALAGAVDIILRELPNPRQSRWKKARWLLRWGGDPYCPELTAGNAAWLADALSVA